MPKAKSRNSHQECYLNQSLASKARVNPATIVEDLAILLEMKFRSVSRCMNWTCARRTVISSQELMASKEAVLSLLSLWMHAWEVRPIVKTKMGFSRFPGRAPIFRRKILWLWLWQNREAHTFNSVRLRNLADRRARRSKLPINQR